MTKNSNKIIFLTMALALVWGLAPTYGASAADLNFSVDTTVSINSANFTILATSAATTMIVGASSLTVTVPADSVFTLRSTNRYTLANVVEIAQQCTDTYNQVVVRGPATSVVITPGNPTTCTVVAQERTAAEVGTLAAQGYVNPDGTDLITATNQATFATPVSAIVAAGDGTATISVPVSTTMTPTAGGNIDLTAMALSNTTSSVAALPTNQTLFTSVQFGIPGTALTFSPAITVAIPVTFTQNGYTRNVYKSSTSATAGWSLLTTCVVNNNLCIFTTTAASYFAVSRTNIGTTLPTASAATNFQATYDGANAILTWTDPTESVVSNLMVVKNGQALVTSPVALGTRRYIDTSITSGQTYTYAIRSNSATGDYVDTATKSITTTPASVVITPSTSSGGGGGGGGGGAYVPPVTVTPTTTPTTPVTTTTTPAMTANDIFPVTVTPVVTTYAYGFNKLSDTAEAAKVKTLVTYLERNLGKKTWANIKAKKGNGWYLSAVKAYAYGNYPTHIILRVARGNNTLIHPTLSYTNLKKAEATAKNALIKYNTAKTNLTKAKNAKTTADKLVTTRAKAVTTAEAKLKLVKTATAIKTATKNLNLAKTNLTKAQTAAKVAADKFTAATNTVTTTKAAYDTAVAVAKIK